MSIKKLCFVLPHMLMAGVEKSLLELLKKIDKSFQIDIYIIKESGDLCGQIPIKNYRGMLPLTEQQRNEAHKSYGKKDALIYHLRKMNFIRAWEIIFEPSVYDYLTGGWDNIEAMPEKYDVAVCYHMHHNFLIGYVQKKITAKKKVMWIHNDIDHSGFPIERYRKYLDEYNLFVCVSEQLKKELIEHIPYYVNRTIVFHNIIDENMIRLRAQEFVPKELMDDRKLKIITVARLEYEKGVDLAIEVAKRLDKAKIDFVWLVLGDGSLKDNLKSKIRRKNLEGKFLLLGNKENPYPYFRECNLVVQMSRHEGFGIALSEALILKKKIISTDVAGAREQIIDGKNGYIVEINVNSVYDKIINIYENIDSILIQEIKSNIDREKELRWLINYFSQ